MVMNKTGQVAVSVMCTGIEEQQDCGDVGCETVRPALLSGRCTFPHSSVVVAAVVVVIDADCIAMHLCHGTMLAPKTFES
jgi:hypothetical protein